MQGLKQIKNIWINGKVQGKGRPRFSRISGTVYTPQPTKDYEARIKAAYRQEGGTIIDSDIPLYVAVTAYIQPPSRWKKAEREDAIQGKIFPQCKPDADNILKIILDGLQGVAYEDDKQVIKCTCTKVYAREAGVVITIYEVKHE